MAENRPRVHIADVDGTQNVPVPIVAIGAAHNPVNLFGVSALSGVKLLRDLIETCESEGKKIDKSKKGRKKERKRRRKKRRRRAPEAHLGHFCEV